MCMSASRCHLILMLDLDAANNWQSILASMDEFETKRTGKNNVPQSQIDNCFYHTHNIIIISNRMHLLLASLRAFFSSDMATFTFSQATSKRHRSRDGRRGFWLV